MSDGDQAWHNGLSPAGDRHAGTEWRRGLSFEAVCDAGVWVCALLAAGWLSREPAGASGLAAWPAMLLAACLVPPTAGRLAGLYQGRYQRGSFEEVIRVGTAGAGTALCLVLVGAFGVPGGRPGPGVIVATTGFALPALLGTRYAVHALRQRPPALPPAAIKIIIFGAGSAGTQLVHRLMDGGSGYQPVALLDDDPAKRRLRICGVPVAGDRSQLAAAAARTGATVLVIAIARADGALVRELTAAAEQCGLVPKVIPSVKEILSGGARIEGVRDPRISDLLGRRPIRTDAAAARAHLTGKRVLVTGAGGSIGSELCRQLHQLQPSQLIMLDRDESALHAVELALHGRALLDRDETVLADIRDPRRVREVFERFQPEVVFHAAALKHLPLLERFPAEALKTNVWGTLTVLEAAAGAGTATFVNISTDKAAAPVSVLGYSKRIAERLTAQLATQVTGSYLSVRFGNVLGSRGSVLESLSAQVAAGGPVTVTHPEVTRYFMTAGEAVQLVVAGAVAGRGGDVLVLDMGEPVRIADIARRLTAATGREIGIVFTGLRPGEKLAEDLRGPHEPDLRPHHPLIMQARVPPLPPGEVTALDPGQDPAGLRAALAALAGQPQPGMSLSGTLAC